VIRHEVPDTPIDALQFPLTGNAPLLRQFLWRRLESSEAALGESVRRHRRFYERVLESGRAITKRDYRRAFAHEEDADAVQQLLFWDMFANESIDAALIREETRRLDAIHPQSNKLDLLRTTLTNEPTLIFTSFIATARDIAKALHVPRAAIDAFKRGVINILVSTDFAAEGLNLQRAGVVIHYDIPWNPVKLDQRNGRAHRIGQKRESVRAVYFLPESRDTRIVETVARKNRVRKRALRSSPAPEAKHPTLRPRVTRDAAVMRLVDAPDLLLRRHKAGIEQLIAEMSREYLDRTRLEHLLALVELECAT
jgi:superfamily II DNA or RNA helicase